jgi:PAS domain S-box-containing protein
MDGGGLTAGLRETLACVERAGDPGEPMTASEVSDHLDVSRRSTYSRLERLADLGVLRTKKTGARGRVWWRPVDPAGAGDPAVGGARDLSERLIETAPVRLVIFEADGSVDRLNPHAWEEFDFTKTEEEGLSLADWRLYDADGDPIPDEERPVPTVFRTGEPVEDRVVQFETPGGREWVTINAAPLRDADGSVERVVGIAKGVSGLKRAERELARQRDEVERELAEVYDRVDDAVFALDGGLRFTYVNDRAAALLDRGGESLRGRPVGEGFPPAGEGDVRERLQDALDRQEATSFEAYAPSLATWVEADVYPSETGVSVYCRDVTDRKERERELERYERLVETLWDGVYALDSDRAAPLTTSPWTSVPGRPRSSSRSYPVSSQNASFTRTNRSSSSRA